ncbi:amidohydrolase family protein [Kocuria sp. LUK]|uniref:amidohydrolase family protein n=1 Tax=Kocuria sp. LUK TaxID=2897828 RepID=UPI001E3B24E1|nr:amidohydrolase family protein [Kocuria sp. LUK]MCD1144280.1 amidohydrolase family protein [Kocuria sp. LUK]
MSAQRVFDAHLHVIDPAHPLVPNQGWVPEPFTLEQYRRRTAGLGIAGGAVVAGSFQGHDQGWLLDALARLGPEWVGVAQLPETVADERILALDAAGVRAVRVNLRRGGPVTPQRLDRLARRVHEVAGWHTELYVDARELPELAGVLGALPAVVVDHLGLHEDGLGHLLGLVERGAVVKATGFGRVALDPARAMAAVLAVDPGALVVGTDLPSTRAARPFADEDLELVRRTVPPEHLPAVLWDTAARLYLRRPRPGAAPARG